MILLRGIAGRRALVVLTVAWAAACSSDKKTLLLVNVSLDAGVEAPTTVSLRVMAGGSSLGSANFPWSQAKDGVLHAGLYLPAGVTGQVRVEAVGTVNGEPTEMAFADNITIEPGKTNVAIELTLQVASTVGDDAGTSEAGAPPTEADALEPDLANSDIARVVPDAGGTEVLATDASRAEVSLPTPDGGAVEASAVDANVAEAALLAPDAGGAEDSPVDGNVSESGLPPTDGPRVDAPSADDTGPAAKDAEAA